MSVVCSVAASGWPPAWSWPCFPFAAIGGGLLAATAAGGTVLGAVAGHAAAGMSRDDLKELGEHLDAGQAGLVVVGVSDMGAKIEREMRRAEKVQKKELKADVEEIEQDAKAGAASTAGNPFCAADLPFDKGRDGSCRFARFRVVRGLRRRVGVSCSGAVDRSALLRFGSSTRCFMSVCGPMRVESRRLPARNFDGVSCRVWRELKSGLSRWI